MMLAALILCACIILPLFRREPAYVIVPLTPGKQEYNFMREFRPRGLWFSPHRYVVYLQYRQQWFGTNLGPWRNCYYLPFDGALTPSNYTVTVSSKDYGESCLFRAVWIHK
jgi:hypothetical protein